MKSIDEIDLLGKAAWPIYRKWETVVDITEAEIIINDKDTFWVIFKNFGAIFDKENGELTEEKLIRYERTTNQERERERVVNFFREEAKTKCQIQTSLNVINAKVNSLKGMVNYFIEQ